MIQVARETFFETRFISLIWLLIAPYYLLVLPLFLPIQFSLEHLLINVLYLIFMISLLWYFYSQIRDFDSNLVTWVFYSAKPVKGYLGRIVQFLGILTYLGILSWGLQSYLQDNSFWLSLIVCLICLINSSHLVIKIENWVAGDQLKEE